MPPSEAERVALLHSRVDQLDARQDATERILIMVALTVLLLACAPALAGLFGKRGDDA